MKKAPKIFLVVACLLLPVLANAGEQKKPKKSAMPEGGNLAGYTLVSGAAMFGALLLARRQRATDPRSN
jgi:hypothetical protein